MEFGVSSGGTINRMASAYSGQIFGFDSFLGLPEEFGPNPIATFTTNGAIPAVKENVTLVKGWFEDTLPKFVEEHKNEKVAFMHIDCDIYSATKCVFDNFKHMFQDGSIIAFDEIIGHVVWEDHEIKAFIEFLEETQYKWECIGQEAGQRAAFIIYK